MAKIDSVLSIELLSIAGVCAVICLSSPRHLNNNFSTIHKTF